MIETLSLKIKVALIVFVVAHLGLFLYVNQQPIYWLQNELVDQRIYWSMDDRDDFHLHTGITRKDITKPFTSRYVDGTYRTRQFSYYMEMLSFKFWQIFEIGFFKNYTLIGIHLLNVFLVGLLLYYLSKSYIVAIIGAGMLLNAGIALTTLLFPFRNAKLLVMTFILISWIIVAAWQRPLGQRRLFKVVLFFFSLFLALLTDEIAFIFVFIPFVYLSLRDGMKSLCDRKVLIGSVSVLFGFLSAVFLSYRSYHIYATHGQTGAQFDHLGQLFKYVLDPHTLWDVFRSFFVYFLRNNMGNWQMDVLGFAAFISSLLLIFLIVKHLKSVDWKLVGALIFSMLIKTFILPHNGGVQSFFMPEDATFPSLYYFNYYYTYCDVVLWAILFGLMLRGVFVSFTNVVVVMCLVSAINISNGYHQQQALKPVLAFHNWESQDNQNLVNNLKEVKKYLADKSLWPIYLSYPGSESNMVTERRHNLYQIIHPHIFYERVVPVMFLPSIEKGRIITSYQNTKSKNALESNYELTNAKTFLDVHTGHLFNIEQIKTPNHFQNLLPDKSTIENPLIKKAAVNYDDIDNILFFVKGRSSFVIHINDVEIKGKQSYGPSYKRFKINLQNTNLEFPAKVEIRITPDNKDNTAYLVGPFFFAAKEEGAKL